MLLIVLIICLYVGLLADELCVLSQCVSEKCRICSFSVHWFLFVFYR